MSEQGFSVTLNQWQEKERENAVLRAELAAVSKYADQWLSKYEKANRRAEQAEAREAAAREAMEMIEFLARGGDQDGVLDIAREFVAAHDARAMAILRPSVPPPAKGHWIAPEINESNLQPPAPDANGERE